MSYIYENMLGEELIPLSSNSKWLQEAEQEAKTIAELWEKIIELNMRQGSI
jgi:hypothetical protein